MIKKDFKLRAVTFIIVYVVFKVFKFITMASEYSEVEGDYLVWLAR